MQKNSRETPFEIRDPGFGKRVIIIPARLSPAKNNASDSGKQICFLFSLHQVEDIIRNEISVYPVPFSPPYVEGIAEWHDLVVPVLSLEGYLGIGTRNPESRTHNTRLMVIRVPSSPGRGSPCSLSLGQSNEREERMMLRVDSSIRMVSLPISCEPVSVIRNPEFRIRNSEMVRGIYEWKEGYLLVMHIFSTCL